MHQRSADSLSCRGDRSAKPGQTAADDDDFVGVVNGFQKDVAFG